MSQRLSEYLEIVDGEARCRKCSFSFGSAERSWKHAARLLERPMNQAGGTPYRSRDHVLIRLFYCPGCGRQLASETAMKGDPFLEDVVRAS